MLTLYVNDQPMQCSDTDTLTLAQWLSTYYPATLPFAVALNGIFIPQAYYAQTPLQSGDQIEILNPMIGG